MPETRAREGDPRREQTRLLTRPDRTCRIGLCSIMTEPARVFQRLDWDGVVRELDAWWTLRKGDGCRALPHAYAPVRR
jgi:hypothetical protein